MLLLAVRTTHQRSDVLSVASAPGAERAAEFNSGEVLTGPAVTVPVGYRPPTNRVPSTGAFLPSNGKPTLAFVDAIWCFFCALARDAVHDLRVPYQDRINFVILDYDRTDDLALARRLGIAQHPAYAVIAAGNVPSEPAQRLFGPLAAPNLRALLDGLVAQTVAH